MPCGRAEAVTRCQGSTSYRWAEVLGPLLTSWAPASLAQGLTSVACDGASANFSNYSCEGCCVHVSCG